ncbi:transposase family protein [Streptomyces anulatus]|uniref:transposase family protein n=1 Tax=Streptomyces anulatus TaxID=1892 RepID=UPI0036FB9FC8
MAVLLVAACAVTAGARSWTAIGHWARSAPQDTLARLVARTVGALALCEAPSPAIIRRVVGAVCPGRTVTQLPVPVPGKTNEITCFTALLTPFDLAGVTVTADALHTQQAHVRFVVEDKKATSCCW